MATTYISLANLTRYDAGIDAKIKAVSDVASANTTAISTLNGAATEAGSVAYAVEALNKTLAAVAKSGNASDVAVADTEGLLDATNVEAALAEIIGMISDAGDAGEVSIEKDTEATDVAARYTIKQGGKALATTIDIPKDMVVKSGSVVVDPEGQPKGTYIKLVLANAEETEIFINVGALIEYVTGGTTDEIAVAVDANTHVVTATIVEINGSKLAAGSVAKAKLDTGVQASLDLADSAIQADDLAAVATSGQADDVVYSATDSVKDALDDIYSQIGEGGSVTEQIKAEIEKLDATVESQTATPDGDGIKVTVVEEDGKLTSVSVAGDYSKTYDAIGAAATAETNAKTYAKGLVDDFIPATNDEIDALLA